LVEKTKDGERWVNVGGRKDFKVQRGDRFILETPGGGGWGAPNSDLDQPVEQQPENGNGFKLPPGRENQIQMLLEQSN
jgi:5-oxoprolinase (ATP-hydrolysing)